MPSPSHRPDLFTARRVFTDRDAARQLFTDQCNHPQGRDEYRILNFFGIGGQGKSALCGQFEAHLKRTQAQGKDSLAWARVNFEEVDKRHSTQACWRCACTWRTAESSASRRSTPYSSAISI